MIESFNGSNIGFDNGRSHYDVTRTNLESFRGVSVKLLLERNNAGRRKKLFWRDKLYKVDDF